jgi:zinc transport system substrate-binding protein
MKKIIIPLLALIVVLSFFFLREEGLQEEKNVSVVTSFYPLYEITQRLGGERVGVVNLTPPGTDPHDFEPSLRNIAVVEKADIFLYNGAGLDPWAEKKAEELREKDSPVVAINLSSYFHLLEGDGVQNIHDYEDNDDSHHHKYDPHIWLDPLIAKEMSRIILAELVKADPEGEKYYNENAKAVTALFEELHAKYRSVLSNCEHKTVVVSHASLGYLAKRYNFEMISISGISPLEEPYPQDLANITNIVRERGIGHIFLETTIPTNLAQTIADETDAETLLINPLESLTKEELSAGEDYFSMMRKNLEKLKTALNCR